MLVTLRSQIWLKRYQDEKKGKDIERDKNKRETHTFVSPIKQRTHLHCLLKSKNNQRILLKFLIIFKLLWLIFQI